MSPQQVLDFWFEEIDPSFWFKKDSQFDQMIRTRFSEVHREAMAGKTASWRKTPEGRLAEIIVLDQFSRNMFRGSAEAFAGDNLALSLAEEAVQAGDDQKLPEISRGFIYMPYMHSEDAKTHVRALKLFSQKGFESTLRYEELHKKIIDRFGRYPHRNKALGRMSTREELEFLKNEGTSF